MLRFELDVEPTTYHAWAVLPDGRVLDWNEGRPSQMQAEAVDSFSRVKLAVPHEPVYVEVRDAAVLAELRALQAAAVRQWVAFALEHFPGHPYKDLWEDGEDRCLISSHVAAKRYGGRVAFGTFGWRLQDGSVHVEYDGASHGDHLEELLAALRNRE